jgi:hypothetical protein
MSKSAPVKRENTIINPEVLQLPEGLALTGVKLDA